MKLLGKCEAQYANNLVAEKQKVLRTDRIRGDNPLIEFYDDDINKIIVIKIYNNISVEKMSSSPVRGAKNRTDIHFNKSQLYKIIDILEPFVNSLSITFDDAPRNTPDPTGMEYPGGMSLGKMIPITCIKGTVIANYAEEDFSVEASQFYIDAERYEMGYKYHWGATMNNKFFARKDSINDFELLIEYGQLKRFLHSMKVAKMWFD